MTGRKKILEATGGEDTTADGTEALPVVGSKYMFVSTIAAYIRTLVQTLTGKTINLTDNTLTGTKAQFNTAMSDADFATLTGTETLSGKTLTSPTVNSPTIATPTITGAITLPDNVRQTFNPGADAAGLNVGSHAGDPGTPANGDLWYDSAANELTARIGGATVALGASAAAVATDTIWDAKGDLAGGTGANTAAKLTVGTDGFVLTADAAETTGLKWAAAPGGGVATDAIWDAKGDLAVGTGANTSVKLTVGANGTYPVAASGETTGIQWATGGRVLIATASPTGTGTQTFSSIPSTYSSLVVEFAIRSTQVATTSILTIALNNDTTDANYRKTVTAGYAASSTATVGADNRQFCDAVNAASGPASRFTIGKITIPFYSNTSFFKQVLSHVGVRTDTATNHEIMDIGALEWESATAIDRVDLILTSGNFETGTIIRLYGMY